MLKRIKWFNILFLVFLINKCSNIYSDNLKHYMFIKSGTLPIASAFFTKRRKEQMIELQEKIKAFQSGAKLENENVEFIEYKGEKYSLGTFRDVTELKKIEVLRKNLLKSQVFLLLI